MIRSVPNMNVHPGALGHDSSKTIGETVAGAANAASGIDLDLATRYFFHQNTLFSVAGLTDENGDLVEAYEYDPYGRHVVITDGPDAGSVVDFTSDDTRTALQTYGTGTATTG